MIAAEGGDWALGAWEWVVRVTEWGTANWSYPGEPDRGIRPLVLEHMRLSYLSILIGLVIALPLGLACARWRPLYPPVLTGVNVLYSIPSIALFFLILPYTGFSDWTAIVPLSLYTLVILLPNVVDGLRQVPDHVRQAAVAMGFSPLRRLVAVETPVAVPVIIAGLRVASVATISMVSVASLVGLGGLGQLILSEGFRRQFDAPIVVGIVLVVLLAFVTDALLVLAQYLLTPWARGDGRRGRPRRGRTAATGTPTAAVPPAPEQRTAGER
ncbi:ABC transporter permease [Nocardiopsis terrae]|uniref:Osmoprotectant transport system permease protein n=1 Tax=Nocardiopsis terrae TaxID=372655 RepID=A0ABR9HL07_9ACTN|nr:ABC transporter permease [Nocardiopsis terrae]MBE1459692.1 osmoprotectant transport system permease protein [Nocardiopsis terrae]GHC94488.1 ABC transporter permease [Nocardiopsis terrae]